MAVGVLVRHSVGEPLTLEQAVEVKDRDELVVADRQRLGVPDCVCDALGEGEPVKLPLTLAVGEPERHNEDVPLRLAREEAVMDSEGLAEADRQRLAVPDCVCDALGEGEPERLPLPVAVGVLERQSEGEPLWLAPPVAVMETDGEGDRVAEAEIVPVKEALAVNDGQVGEPADVIGQKMHVELSAAPSAALKNPAGHGVAFSEATGQKCPAMHVAQVALEAAPVALLKVPAGQSDGPAAPPAHHWPPAHCETFEGEVEPAGQKKPGAAAQSPEQAGEARPDALPKVPAGHGEQVAAPGSAE